MKFSYSIYPIFLVLIFGCTTKSDTYYNRQFQMIPTMYNVLYNGNEALAAGKKELDLQHKENYAQILPVEPLTMADQISLNGEENPNFARAEEKAIKAIQKHSMVFDGVQKNRKIDDAYMLLGKARFYNQRFIPALQAFDHLISNYGETNRRAEALLWKEKTNIYLGRERQGIEILTKFLQEEKVKREDRAGIQATLAQGFIQLKEYDEAIISLKKASKTTRNKEKKGRYYFITAQLYEHLSQPDSAATYFKKVIKLNRKVHRRLWIEAQAGKVRNGSFDAETLDKELLFFKKLQKQYEHKSFLDILYFQTALLQLKKGDNNQALTHFNKSKKHNTENPELKGQTHKHLADLYFTKKDYLQSHMQYDSTLVYVPENTLEHLYIRRKRDNLTEVAKLENIVNQTDSIFKITNLSEKEQMAYFQNYVDSLQKTTNSGKNTTNLGSGKSNVKVPIEKDVFYFYSPNAVAFGKQAFTEKFGHRELADNWKYTDLIQQKQTENFAKNATKNDTLSAKDLLQKLPEAADLQLMREEQNEALYKLGILYSEKFSDNSLAINRFERILNNQPKQELHERTLYYLFKLNSDKAESYKNELLNRYPNSDYVKAIQQTNNLDTNELSEKLKRLELEFENQNFQRVLSEIQDNKVYYKTSPSAPDWDFLQAKVLGRLQGVAVYKSELEKIVNQYPNSSQAKKIKEILATLQTEITPDFEPDNRASSWKIVYEDLPEERRKALENWLDQNGLSFIRVTNDFYKENEKLVVLHGFFSKQQADDMFKRIFLEFFNNNLKMNCFVISAENYNLVQMYKLKQEYINR